MDRYFPIHRLKASFNFQRLLWQSVTDGVSLYLNVQIAEVYNVDRTYNLFNHNRFCGSLCNFSV